MSNIIEIITQAGSFIAAFAAIAAGFVLANMAKKFNSGIFASNFRSISTGIFLIGFAILIDAIQTYVASFAQPQVLTFIIIVKEILFVIGTYVIVIGSKKTADSMETMTK